MWRKASRKLDVFSEKGLQVFFSILEVIEIYTTQLEMGKAHILNSATVLSSVIGMGDLLHSINNCRCREEIRWDGWMDG